MVLGSVGVASSRSSVWTAGITRSVCGVATFVGGGGSISSFCSTFRWRVSVSVGAGAYRESNVCANIDREVSVGGNGLPSTVVVLETVGSVFFGVRGGWEVVERAGSASCSCRRVTLLVRAVGWEADMSVESR